MAAPKNNKNAIGNEGGAPSKYRPEYAEQAYKLTLLGLTDKELAQFFEVSKTTLNQWKKNEIEFMNSLRRGKTVADGEVAVSLFKRAVGFNYDELTFEKLDGKVVLEATENELIKTDTYKKKIVTKHVIPDTGAITLWLKNRQGELWRDKQELLIDYDSMSDEQLDRIIDKITNGQLKK